MARPTLLGGLRARAELEERCRTVTGALDVVGDPGALEPVTWLTVPDVLDVLEAVALREFEERRAARREEHPRRLAGLRPTLPEPGVTYELPEFTERFQALLECLRLHGELDELEEVMALANLGAAFVLDPEAERNPLLDNLAGELLWAVGDGLAADAYRLQALEYFGAAGDALHEARMPLDVRRSYDLMITERCLDLLKAGLPQEEELLGTANAALTRIAPAYDRLPAVAAARFTVARLSGDRPALERLASRSALGEAERRDCWPGWTAGRSGRRSSGRSRRRSTPSAKVSTRRRRSRASPWRTCRGASPATGPGVWPTWCSVRRCATRSPPRSTDGPATRPPPGRLSCATGFACRSAGGCRPRPCTCCSRSRAARRSRRPAPCGSSSSWARTVRRRSRWIACSPSSTGPRRARGR
ncbi:hypothetical protein [Nonomuraea sp. NPDC050643]|uniref:hypothetical protein n=1 Tax=Nonomuraea sp. NPDC050643 TaxID=3155660 RepID=UPI0033D19300